MVASNKYLWLCVAVLLMAGLSSENVNFSWSAIASIGVLTWYYRRNIAVICKTFPRDLRSMLVLRTTHKILGEYQRKNLTIIDLFRKQLDKHPQKAVFYFEDQIWTYADVETFSNKIANVFREAGYEKGDVVALLMGNCVEYIGIWFGLAKIGVITALINTNLRNQSLVHCLNTAKVKALVYSEEHDATVDEVSKDTELVKKYRWGKSSLKNPDNDLVTSAERASKFPPTVKDEVGYRDKVLYVYTSGTTGLPKAAVIPHHRLLLMSLVLSCVMGIKETEIIYNPLPLYHTAGGLLGIAGALTHGFSSVIKKKFSATSYWPDCIKYNCTSAQYIGEMCRYVMMVPPRPEDTQHKVKYVFGNGMRTSLWTEFQERFHLEQIREIYGSTEGNLYSANLDETVGAIGFLPRCIPESLIPMALIKVDEFGEPIRNSEGFCIRSAPNKPGMFVGMIVNADATREYSGYVGDKKESEKKVIHNVFKKGDKAFLSGDLLVMDELGYLFFKDRTGDTFKWKGENVSTAEVEGIVSTAAGFRDVLVYGVEVGNLEGRAGMATIVDPDSKVDLKTLTREIDKNLPSYARPLFLRFTDHVDLTGTFKLKKLNFQKEGFNPEKVKDRLYFKNGRGGYVPLTKNVYEDVVSGRVRV